jgi:flagellar assembly protein FliH
MSSSSRHRDQRARVLRAADVKRETVATADLGVITAPAARSLVVDRRLIDDALADGFRAGQEAGFQAGMEEAQQAGAEQTRQAIMALHQVIGQLNETADTMRRREATAAIDIENEVVRAAFEIACVLVGHELEHSASIGNDAIARALQVAPREGVIVARLHPAIAGMVDPEAAAPGRSLQVVADPTVAPGDCIVDVNGCHIDARLDAALERVRALLGSEQP